VTDVEGLTRASRRERELYGELTAAYAALDAALGADPTTCDMDALVAAQARADVAAAALRVVSAAVAPVRLSGEAVPDTVRADWAASAALAAEATAQNAALVARARDASRATVTRLGAVAVGRRGTRAYDRAAAIRRPLADARA
jgi:hypothetical protein